MLATKEQRAEDRSRRVRGCDGGMGKRGAREDRLQTQGLEGEKALGAGAKRTSQRNSEGTRPSPVG